MEKSADIDFIPIDYDYFDFKGQNYMKIFGRDKNNKRVCLIDTCPIYFWAILKDGVETKRIKNIRKEIEEIQLDKKGRQTKVEKVELKEKNFLGKKVKALKIFATNYKDLHDIVDLLGYEEIEKRRGYDLGFVTHYIRERKIKPLEWCSVSGKILDNSEEFNGLDRALDVDRCIQIKKISISDKETNQDEKFIPNALAYDIETDKLKIGQGEILMVSLVSREFKRVISWKSEGELKMGKDEKPSYVEFVKDEKELLKRFCEHIKNIKPDCLIGYNSDGFDMPYLKARAEKNNVKLPLSLDGTQPKFSNFSNFNSNAKLKGIVHVDLIKFIRAAYAAYMQSETLSLNEVSKEFLGDSKKEFRIKESSQLDKNDFKKYYEYNLHDSCLALNLFEKFWPDMKEFTKVMSEPLFDIIRNSMSKNVESYILHNLDKFDEIPEKRPTHKDIGERRSKDKYEGGFVYEPTPGIYEKISMFDFTSSYGSVIVTYNLSRSTYLHEEERKQEKSKKTHQINIHGKELEFSLKQGFFPRMLEEIIKLRKKFKSDLKNLEEKNKQDTSNYAVLRARSNAFKLLANASYGYLGFFGARYYCYEAAAATAAFARKSIKEAIDNINNEGYETIYSDTDSIAFARKDKSKKEVNDFLKKLNSKMPGIMELELEGFFKRGIWVTKRSGKLGAKKKYALIDENDRIKIRGFETVRRDWCALARKTQNKIISLVLEDGNEKRALKYLREIVSKIKNKEIEIHDLIIKTQLKKPLEEYKAVSPHIVAARKMQENKIPISEGNLIEYYISDSQTNKNTKNKKQSSSLVRDRVKLPTEEDSKEKDYDIEYYLERQILPAVENILNLFNVKIKELIDGKRQTTLGDF